MSTESLRARLDAAEKTEPSPTHIAYAAAQHRDLFNPAPTDLRLALACVELLDKLTSPNRIQLDGCGECIWCRARAAVDAFEALP